MKTKLLFALGLMSNMFSNTFAQTDSHGYTTVKASMGASYQNTVFFDLSTNKLTSQPANTWDVAFYRNGAMSFGTRINDAQNIETYQASIDPTEWDKIDVANISNWGSPLYNPDISDKLENGAFEQAKLTCSVLSTGWGCYSIGNHHVDGKSIYVLKYPDGSFIKFMITDYFGGYTFKYSKSNGTTWGTTVTKTIANGSNDTLFNYYSLLNDSEVSNLEPPKTEWDFMLSRYWTFYNGQMMYRLSGILQGPNITVAKTTETQSTSTNNLPAETEFKKGITTIGHSWKPTSGLIADVVYYIKEGNSYYRMYFTENGGATTGNMYFKYKDITSTLSTNDIKSIVSFGIYPNPSTNKQVTLLVDLKNAQENNGIVSFYDVTGRKVYETEISKQQGFFKKEINLSQLQSGMYIVNIKVGSFTESKKLVLK